MSQLTVIHSQIHDQLDLITENLPWLDSAAIGIWLEVGSRDEHKRLNGIAHFYEHMVFKGTRKFSALDTVYAIEAKGGYINAFTSRENTCFYARCTSDEVKTALEILCNMVGEPLLDQESFDLEKGVILEEIRSTDDAPDEQISDLFSEALWNGRDLGMPIAGSLKTVKRIQQTDLLEWQNQVLHNHRIVIAAAGRVDHEQILQWVQDFLPQKRGYHPKERPWFESNAQHLIKKRALQQSNVMMGTRLPYTNQRERLVLNVFNTLFGDGMAARLFQNIREKYGLVYSIYSGADFYFNHNAFNISFSTDGPKVAQTLELVSLEITKVLQDGVEAKELDFAKHALRGTLLLGLEAANARMNRIARQVLYNLPLQTPSETVEEIFSINLEEVRSLVQKIFRKDQWSSAWLGSKQHQIDVADYLKF